MCSYYALLLSKLNINHCSSSLSLINTHTHTHTPTRITQTYTPTRITHTQTHTHTQIASWYSIKGMANLFYLPMTHLNQQAAPNHKRCELSPLPRYHLVTSMTYLHLHMCYNIAEYPLTSDAENDKTCIHSLVFQRLYRRVRKISTSNY
jgi:hypothetical protein